MAKVILYLPFTFMLACSFKRETPAPPIHHEQQRRDNKEKNKLAEIKTQEKNASEVVPIPHAARDPIIDSFIQFTFGRGVNEPDEHGRTPLMEAIKNRDERSTIVLLEHPRIDLDVIDGSVDTALHNSIVIGSKKTVKMLLNKGANVNVKNKHGYTPLHLASMRGSIEIVKILLDNGAEVSIRDDAGWTALHQAASHQREANVALLLKRGVDVNAKTKYWNTALHFAAMRGNIEIVKILLDNGAEVNTEDPYKAGALKTLLRESGAR
jgi:ankyrin repeat protein